MILPHWRAERGYVLTKSVNLVNSNMTDGDIAEFGVMEGQTFHILAAALADGQEAATRLGLPPKALHGFDSFQGLPRPSQGQDLESPMVASGVWREGKMAAPAVKAAEKAGHFLAPGQFTLFTGFFTETLPAMPSGQQYALVHIDCDLYESTMQVLDWLFSGEHLADGAVLLFDDFLENRGSPKYGQRAAWTDARCKHYPQFTDLGYYARCSWRCIIHR